jgi:hypothetical protein
MVEYFLRRINTRALTLLVALILSVGGLLLVYLGIKDDGFIDLKSAFIEGKLRSGLVGVTIIFLSVVLCLACVLVPIRKEPYTIEISHGGHRIKWSGSSRSIGAKFVSMIESMDLLEKKESKLSNDKA